jgi:hypothetical protein
VVGSQGGDEERRKGEKEKRRKGEKEKRRKGEKETEQRCLAGGIFIRLHS